MISRYVLIFLSFTILTIHHAFAQRSMPWTDGIIELTDGKRMEGKIQYNFEASEGLVRYKSGKRILTYSPASVRVFSFTDTRTNQYREFHSLMVNDKIRQVKRKYFLELLFEGELVTLLKQHYSLDNRFSPDAAEKDQIKDCIILMDMRGQTLEYYSQPQRPSTILIPGGKPIFNTDLLYRLTSTKESEVAAFVHKHQINLKTESGLIATMTEFHHLMRAEYNLVSAALTE
jgi:hypothetical protein